RAVEYVGSAHELPVRDGTHYVHGGHYPDQLISIHHEQPVDVGRTHALGCGRDVCVGRERVDAVGHRIRDYARVERIGRSAVSLTRDSFTLSPGPQLREIA